MTADPFGTEELRQSVLRAWRDSPTRFTEDANAEEDLRIGGYRDRLFVELAQNAADASAATGVPGTLRASIVDGELRVANTGAPLDAAGVAALASLRASAKRAGTVGRFGVGFAAVLAVTADPRIVSTTGGVAFSERRTQATLAGSTELAERLRERSGNVPVLRMAWPAGAEESPVPQGFSTEVRLPLRADVDGAALLADLSDSAPDLLLALPWLERIEVGESAWQCRQQESGVVLLDTPTGVRCWLRHRETGTLGAGEIAGLGVEAQERPQWSVCWALPVDADGAPEPLDEDVLHAPTPTDERISLPARLIATLPVEPSRRRALPGPAGDAVLAEAARCYPALVRCLAAEHRPAMIPAPGFPRSEVDDKLRELVVAELRGSDWLAGADGAAVLPARARMLDVPAGFGGRLTELLVDVLDGLLPAEFADKRWMSNRLAGAGVHRMGLAEVVEALTGIARPPEWWHRLYDALAPLAEADAGVREELGGLPVPLASSSMRFGPRGALLPELSGAEELLARADLPGLALVHSDAVHPLLERLGAVRAGPLELLDSDPLRAALELDAAGEASGPSSTVDEAPLADVVLRLVELAGVRPGERPWLSALALPDARGDRRRADELVLPGSAILEVLAPDAPLGVLADSVAGNWSVSTLAAAGVLSSFAVLADDGPTGPDHELAGEDEWWAGLSEPPAGMLAVRDLDLVDEQRWPHAIRLLAAEPETLRALREPGGYTAWWLARNAVLGGHPPRHWRLPEATELAGLYDPLPDVGLDVELCGEIGVRSRLRVADASDAGDLLARLADPARDIPASVVLSGYSALASAVVDEVVDTSDVDPPERVRTVDGAVCAADDAVVLDGPWLLGVLAPGRVVAARFGLHDQLAELLDLPLGSEEAGEPPAAAEWFGWHELSAARVACELLAMDIPDSGVQVHDELRVDECAVSWWACADGTLHAEDSPDGLARALAWATGNWEQRHLIAALLAEPEPHTLLS
ncbi:MAG: hypothetical protein GEU98_01970 [Pseudonocardiaceae bacterium]|nr:hypothetical protein [Pseudonocardiaceae bacterium]